MDDNSTLKILPTVHDKPPDDTLPPGALLNHDKYRIERFLGRGGFGVTYMALDQTLGLRVAVKECLPRDIAWRNDSATAVQWRVSAPEQKTVLESFVKEARKMAKIDQIPGVVRVREYFYDNDTAYIVMDYVDGETLTQRLSRTRKSSMSAEECFRLLSPVMDSLALAHERGLIHRDVTPNNIMIEKDGERVWLLDLGAAKDLGTRDFAPNVSKSTQIVGTPGYMPLEQCYPNGKIGPWTDIYALSAVFVRCIAGQALPPSTSRAMEDKVPEALRSNFGKVGAALLKGLAQKPEKRYQTMPELRAALEKALQKPKFPKKALLLVAVLLVLALIPLSIMLLRQPPPEIVASGECGENASWTLDKNGLLIISGTGDMADYHYLDDDVYDTPWYPIKDTICSVNILYGITDIGEHSFFRCSNLTSVKIPNSVREISDSAFQACTSLMSVKIPNSVTTIGKHAFWACHSLASVTIPDSVTEIGEDAFSLCEGLASVKISDSVTEISGGAFQACTSLTNIIIPDSVIKILMYAFCDCTSLTSVTISDSVTEIGERAFWGCSSLTSVTIPDSVTEIGEYAFSNCRSLPSVIIPVGVTEIGERAFSGCTSLTSVTIPDTVTDIGVYTFGACTSLTSVTIPNSVTEIGWNAFQDCSSLTNVTIPDSVTEIGRYAFSGCTSLASVSVSAEAHVVDGAFDENTTVTRR